MDEEKWVITAAEAESLLVDGADTIHSFTNPTANLLLGCDYDRADAIAAFKKTDLIEIAGPAARNIKHAIAAWEDDELTYFECDMDKLAELEARRLTIP